MTTTLTPTRTAATTATSGAGALTGTGAVATLGASVATMTVAAAGHAAGVSLDIAGAPIPVTGFGVLTAVFSLVGVVLAVVLQRTTRNPRRCCWVARWTSGGALPFRTSVTSQASASKRSDSTSSGSQPSKLT